MPSFRILLPILLLATSIPANVPRDDFSGVSRELKLRLVEEINHDRRAGGLRPVEFSDELSMAADAHCREMLNENYTSHWNRAGWKPYMRYSAAGVRDFTEENIFSLWRTNLDTSEASLWKEMLGGHRGFLTERPPYDGHRRSLLSPRPTHVGIGLAFDAQGMRLIEVFSARYAQLEPLPQRVTLRDTLSVTGRVADRNLRLFGVAIYYEPLPRPMASLDLRKTHSYSLPEEHQMERLWHGEAQYIDGSQGSILVNDAGKFSLGLRFWKKLPGVYTIGVWVSEKSGRDAFLGALESVFVEEGKKGGR
jgi:hypothetical protein